MAIEPLLRAGQVKWSRMQSKKKSEPIGPPFYDCTQGVISSLSLSAHRPVDCVAVHQSSKCAHH